MLSKKIAMVVALAGVAFVMGRNWPVGPMAMAQPPKPEMKPAKPDAQPPAGMPDMEAMMAAMTPGDHHKVLEVMLGNWEGEVKFWMAPGTDPMSSQATITREWAMGGRFVIEKVDGTTDNPDQRFNGMGIMGYNNMEKRYETAWIENMSTAITTSTGTYDAAKKTFTFQGEMYDPMTQKKTKSRTVLDVSDPNKEIMTGYGPGPDGKEFKNFEGIFSKKK
ncbi:MAG: DUF1579 domain-containing protein [Phycisphaerales bacterium]